MSIEHHIKDLQIRFERDGNAVYVLKAYLLAHEAAIPLPVWAVDHIGRAFKRYVESEGQEDLERLLGLSVGKGQMPPFAKLALEARDFYLMLDVFKLESLGISIDDAAYMVQEKQIQDGGHWEINSQSPKNLSCATIADRYVKEGWREKNAALVGGLNQGSLLADSADLSAFLESFPEYTLPSGLKSMISHR